MTDIVDYGHCTWPGCPGDAAAAHGRCAAHPEGYKPITFVTVQVHAATYAAGEKYVLAQYAHCEDTSADDIAGHLTSLGHDPLESRIAASVLDAQRSAQFQAEQSQ